MAKGQYLSEKEIDEFLSDLDNNNNGVIEYDELEFKLDEVHKEIAPEAKPHNLHHKDRDNTARHTFLRSIIGTDKNRIPRDEFQATVKKWNIPSLDPDKKAEVEHEEYMRQMGWGRRIKSHWNVDGPEWLFLGLVVSMQIAFGTWQLVKYLTEVQYRQAFGWGVVLAKTSAGILYPTMFFLILSMSRYISTFARRSYYLSRFINWDLSQSFHIKISCVALGFASLHAIGHLTGSFLYGSRPAQQDKVAALLGPDAVPRPYVDYVRSLPGWSGITALGLFWTLALLSMPRIRKYSYELFQIGHLLMFPIIGLLIAHGTAQLLQFAMLGYWLAIPTLLVLFERIGRIACGFHRISAKIEILDEDTVVITALIPNYRYWKYEAGQYVLLQVPKLSLFQWHPFTISTCVGNEMQVHIKTDGDWTNQLRGLCSEAGSSQIHVGIDGPFGAPAQRFYDFETSIVFGSGIGVTPFSGILTDLQLKSSREAKARATSDTGARSSSASQSSTIISSPTPTPTPKRRVDFHWIVKDKNYLLWFSNLLNNITRSAPKHKNLEVNIYTHVTQKRKSVATHIYRCLLEMHRTDDHPESPLTGLLNETHFGRPDLGSIMEDHYESLLKEDAAVSTGQRQSEKRGSISRRDRRKVGVFFCGAPVIGYELADRCQRLTVRGREDGSMIEYHFMMEVFG
ncbi:FAD-binding domain-containing protein [Phlyctema vagabunda]|uniref:FAD-binding domain-containing protein n=1 Tax=Phlyctema vagabunda TaxID=108571 RepID=A0ABR4PBC1_9HELO